ncbi:ABC transporter substrate-binding protein [Corynebacterium liangguodongii]|uniref:ABC transporter substrate-binding protein n=1 Tax=Corynebacterium liangguodongii TaxID=2079535 RepID=A0A2S0WCV8_9CORY|nr:ABC transporter substrate-binding protein [Corynebacterium liangguodongii]AWB83512.1 ABC transporter substrate-binding protein [Corynebacterium liangguodongii]PWC00399.1 ABC transporter substrate-binding protein [Corynebacterium liangguodongii]
MNKEIACLAGGILTVGLALGACAAPDDTGAAPAATSPTSSDIHAAQWPRTVEVDGAAVDIPSEPKRIVAVSTETADLALQLAGPDRVAAVSKASQDPAGGTQAELASQVEVALPAGTDPDPEQILALDPDLVLTTARHGGEKTAGEQLQATGVAVLNFSAETFASPEGVAAATRTLGRALGEEEKAEELAGRFETSISKLDEAKVAGAPRFAALMSRGGKVMAMADGQMLPGLAARAGGMNAGGAVGITQPRPIDAEMLAKMAPEVIFVEDFRGQGLAPFAELLANPALADIPAVKNQRVHAIPATDASGVSGLNTDRGYAAIVEALGLAVASYGP